MFSIIKLHTFKYSATNTNVLLNTAIDDSSVVDWFFSLMHVHWRHQEQRTSKQKCTAKKLSAVHSRNAEGGGDKIRAIKRS